jgi:mRNA interferase MazF
VDQILALDGRRFLEKLGKLSSEKALELRGKLGVVMDY